MQALLAKNAAEYHSGNRWAHASLLAGMIRDGQDRPMSPSHANKGRRRYRYYVSNEAVPTGGAPATRAMRLPAKTTERAVLDAVSAMLEGAEPIRER